MRVNCRRNFVCTATFYGCSNGRPCHPNIVATSRGQSAAPAQSDFSALNELLSQASNDDSLKQWLMYNKLTLSLAHLTNIPESNLGRQHLAQALLAQLGDQPIGEEIANSLPDNLRAQAAWFECLGESDVAEFTLACAEATPVAPLSQNPLMNRLLVAILASLIESSSTK